MKKKFTFLTAAFMLLAFLAVPLGMRGQSDYSTDYAGNVTLSTTGGTSASACKVVINNIQYDGVKAGTSSVFGAMKITVPSGTKYLHLHVAAWNGDNSSSLSVTPNSYSENITLKSNSGISGNSPFTFSGDPSTSDYYKVITFTTALTAETNLTFTATGGKRFVIWGVTAEEDGGSQTETHTLTFTANPLAGGTVSVYGNTTGTITLEENATVNVSAIPAELGYAFYNWTYSGTGASVGDTTSASTTFTMGTSDATLRANFSTVNTYTVTYKANGPEAEDVVDTYNEGATATLRPANTFSYSGHSFTEWKTVASGDGTSYDPGDEISNINANHVLFAQWEEVNEVVDELTRDLIGVTGTSYSDWNGKEGISGAVYAGNSAGGNSNSGDCIQIRSNNNKSGIVSTTSGGNVKKVTVSWCAYGNNGLTLNIYGSNTAYENASDLYGDNSGTLLGTIVKGTSTELTINGNYAYVGIRSNSGAIYLNEIDITWVTEGAPAPYFTITNNDELQYNATSGSFNFTVTNSVQGGYTTVGENVDWISEATVVNGNTVTFTTVANPTAGPREGVVTLTYHYGEETKTHDVTVTQAANPNVVYNTMQGIFDMATQVGNTATSVSIAPQNWVVSGVATNGKNVFVTDGTKGFVIYNKDGGMGFTTGDILSGTVACKVQLYNGFAEITELNSETSGLSVATGGTVTVANIAMADLAGVNTGALVSYENLTCSVSDNKYYLSDGTTTLQVYNALFAFDAPEDGKSYNITGVYQQFNNTKEILPRSADDIEEVVSAEPSITVTPTTVNVDANAHEESLAITLQNIEVTDEGNFEIYFYESDGTTVADYSEWLGAEVIPSTNEGYEVYCAIQANSGVARQAYLKVYVLGDDSNEATSGLITINQAAPVIDYATLPFEYDGNGQGELPNGLTVNGTTTYTTSPKIQFNSTGDWLLLHFNERPGTLTFDIKGNSFSGGTFKVQTSVDGETYTDLETYTELGSVQNESFDNLGENVRYIKWIYTEKSSGNVALGNIALAEYSVVASITVDPDELDLNAEEHNGTLDLTYENLTITAANNFAIQYYDAEDNELNGDDEPDWIEVLVAEQDPNIGEGYVVSYYMVENEGDARTAYFKVFAMDGEEFVYSNLVTISQAAPVAPPTPGNWVLTAFEDLTPADVFVIVGNNSYAMENDGNSNPVAVEVTVSGDALSGSIADNIQWNFSGNATLGYTFYPAGSADKWLYCNTNTTSSNNTNMRIGTGGSYKRSIFVYDENNQLSTEDEFTKRYLALNGSSDWRGYVSSSTNTTTITFYKKVNADETFIKEDIVAYTGSNDHYYLIASPVASVAPADGNGFLTEEYDLYYFDESQEAAEWRNYEDSETGGFNLVSGKGYLYASSTGTDLTFTGQPYNGNGLVELSFTSDNQFAGWNLIGNPFATAAALSQPYFRLNADGNKLNTETEDANVAVMEGVFVHATAAGQTAVFTAQSRGGRQAIAKANLQVVGNNGTVIDNAIVRFDNGETLEKFIFGNPAANIYFAQDGKEYAIVRSEAQGEMPVNFKAAENGTYTISVEAENLSVEYLHLIDNMTGANVDLLATPSYTFEARKNDYASRFRLVFNANAGNSEVDDDFAFVSDGNIVISNEGEATLQVIDMLGRVISTQIVNGSASIENIGVSGVYVLRLVNGNNVKTQRIVVR